MRRSIIAIGAVSATLALAGCGSNGADPDTTPEPDATPDATAAPGGDQTLTLWVDDNRFEEMGPIVEAFHDETGVTVELVLKASADIGDDFIAQVPTGEGPDMIISAHDGLGGWVTNGVVAPIELGDLIDGFAPVASAAVAYDNQYYGVPLSLENVALIRNNDVLSETNATTFDELIQEGIDAGAEYPVLIQQGDNGDPYHMYPLQTSFGAQVFAQNEDGSYIPELQLGGAEGHAFAEYLAELGERGILHSTIDGAVAGAAFDAGESPYSISGPWAVPNLQEIGMDFTVLPIPSAGGQESQPFVGVQGLFISAQSNNPLLANQFAQFLATEEIQDLLYDVSKRSPALEASAAKVDDPVVAGFTEAGANGAPMPAIPQMSEVWQFWGSTEVQIIDGQVDPIEGWDAMVANIQEAIS